MTTKSGVSVVPETLMCWNAPSKNKSDLVSKEEVVEKANQLDLTNNKKWLAVSSSTGFNIAQLKTLIYQALDNAPITEEKNEIQRPEIRINYED